jgi:glutamyl-Q tRNA(Asp) synthetase
MPHVQQRVVTRFAPSPNGRLHLGHAYAAICAHDFARANDGRFLLRIEDIDGTRSRVEFIDSILADMRWLGLEWDGDIVFQSARLESYGAALERLREMGLIYKCICSRGDIADAIRAKTVRHGPDGPHYPGTCKGHEVAAESGAFCWRLNMAKAVESICELYWLDLTDGEQIAEPSLFGDIILWRKDAPASYHLAATLDDAADGISHVVRGRDLFAYTHIHRLLQALFGLPVPFYWHHDLLVDGEGSKLAKSSGSASLKDRRLAGEDGLALADALRRGELPLGIGIARD